MSLFSRKLEVSATGDVTLTLAGRRVRFQFTPQSGGFPFYYLYTPAYTPEAGLHGTLTPVNGCGTLMNSPNGYLCFPDTTSPYQPSGYVYTDAYGRVYTISSTGGLQSIKDLNGNTLTVTAGGITSSNGSVSVPFGRDSLGRITQITDPKGAVYRYSYDANGNLTQVTLPPASSTVTYQPIGYSYDGTHLLTGINDPRGNAVAQSTYSADGRLQSVTQVPSAGVSDTTSYAYSSDPVTGSSTTTTTNPDGGVESVTVNANGDVVEKVDALKRSVTYTYDAARNKATETDALGKTTTYLYDGNGNKTSITDAYGHPITAVYNQYGGPTKVTDALSQTQNLSYDANYNLASITDALSPTLGPIASFTYNGQGLPATLTDARKATTSFQYDAYGNQTYKLDALKRETDRVYDVSGNLTSETNPRRYTSSYGYDTFNNRVSMTDATNATTTYEYDGDGNKTAMVDALKRRTTYVYDNLNRLVQTNYPDGKSTSATYDFRGNKLSETDEAGHVTSYVYDVAGQLKSKTLAAGTADAATTTYLYDPVGRKTSETDARGAQMQWAYDDVGRLVSVTDGAGDQTSYGYDAKNQRTSMTDAKGRTTRYDYDVRGRLWRTTYPDGKTVVKTFDGMGAVLSTQDEEAQTTSFGYDAVGQLTTVTDALKQLTQYGYDAAGNKASQTDANQHTTAYLYDPLNRRTSRQLPAGQSESDTWDAVGNKQTHTDFNGRTTTFGYDARNRLLSKTPDARFAGAPVVRYTYTATGQRASMADASGTTSYGYDNQNRLTTKQTPQGTLTYTYDGSSHVASVVSSNANGTNVAYAWDGAGRLASVTDNRTGLMTSYTYDATNNVSAVATPGVVTHSFGYDPLRDRLTGLGVASGSAGTLATYAYTYGPSGHKLSAAEASGRASTYAYDPIYRLTNEAITGDPVAANNGSLGYSLDKVGNRLGLTSSLAALASQTKSYDADDRMSGDTYDANGNTLTSGGHGYQYDFEDHLVQADAAVLPVYDGDGGRVARTEGGATTRYLVDDLNPTGYAQVVEEVVGGSVVAQYTVGKLRVSQRRLIAGTNWQVSYYGYDGGRSVRQLLDSTGAVTDMYAYDAFGNVVAQTGTTVNPYLYRGEYFDQTLGMYYLRARYYVPRSGRFLTADKYEAVTTQSCDCRSGPSPLQLFGVAHLYGYANIDPLDFIDPMGNAAESEYGLLSRVQLVTKKFLASSVGMTIYSFCRVYSIFRLVGSAVTQTSYGSVGVPVDVACGLVTLGPWTIGVSSPPIGAVLDWFALLSEGLFPRQPWV